MRGFPIRKAISVAIGGFALTACGGTSGAPPLAGSAAQAQSVQNEAQITNVSGQYSGTIKDSEYGKGKATFNVAQYKNAAGGIFTVIGTQTVSAPATYVVSGTTLRGTGVSPGSPIACVFTESAKYDSSTRVLSGSYRAPHGCSGEAQSGTFTMKRQCYYASDWVARPENGLKQC
jgi:hypothetical protein